MTFAWLLLALALATIAAVLRGIWAIAIASVAATALLGTGFVLLLAKSAGKRHRQEESAPRL